MLTNPALGDKHYSSTAPHTNRVTLDGLKTVKIYIKSQVRTTQRWIKERASGTAGV